MPKARSTARPWCTWKVQHLWGREGAQGGSCCRLEPYPEIQWGSKEFHQAFLPDTACSVGTAVVLHHVLEAGNKGPFHRQVPGKRKGRSVVLIPSMYYVPQHNWRDRLFEMISGYLVVWGFCMTQQLPAGILQKTVCTRWHCSGSETFTPRCSLVLLIAVMMLQSRYSHLSMDGIDWFSSVLCGFFLRLFFIKDFVPVSQTHLSVIRAMQGFLIKADFSAFLSASSWASAPAFTVSQASPLPQGMLPCLV